MPRASVWPSSSLSILPWCWLTFDSKTAMETLIRNLNPEEVVRESWRWTELPQKIRKIPEEESSSSRRLQSLLDRQTVQLSALDDELSEWVIHVHLCTHVHGCASATLMLTSSFAYCPKKILLNTGRNMVGSLKPQKIDTNSNSLWNCRTILTLLWTYKRS